MKELIYKDETLNSGIELMGWATVPIAIGMVKSQKYMGENPITKDHQPNQPLNPST